jgi:purine nucleosidase
LGPEPILIDCDPGHDDAIALLMALAHPDRFNVLGVTTVAGNTDVAQAARNAAVVCALAGRADLPIRAGCARPLVNPFRDATAFHGPSGLDGLGDGLPLPSPHPQHAVDFIIDRLNDSAVPVTLVCLGPLTNIAVTLIKAPHLGSKIREIVFMGGARRTGGNVTPCATFNVFCDPHAAQVVFESGCPLSIVSLDATSEVVAGDETLKAMAAVGNECSDAAYRILKFFNRRRVEVYGYSDQQTTLNDPCVMAYLLHRDLFSGYRANVVVEHRSDVTMGMTIVDSLGVTGRPANAFWIDHADGRGVREALLASLSLYAGRASGRT